MTEWLLTGRGRPTRMSENLKKGDHVEWNAHGGKNTKGGKADGVVEKELTSDTDFKGRTFRASKDDPRYLVESEKSGGEDVHTADAMHKKK